MRGGPCTPAQPPGDGEPEQRVRAPDADVLIERKRSDHRKVEHQVRLVVDAIGGDGQTGSAAYDVALPGNQGDRRYHRNHRNNDAVAGSAGPRTRHQLINCAKSKDESRQRNQDDLKQRREGLGLAMAESVIVVGGMGRNPHPRERGKAGDQIESGIGKATQHRGRSGR